MIDTFMYEKHKPKNLQLSVTVIEARDLKVENVSVAVEVQVDQQRKVVRAKTKKTVNPYFNELCQFTFYEPLDLFLKKSLRLAIRKNTNSLKKELIGQSEIELSTIWNQPNHHFQRKWTVLLDPKDANCGVNGYLKCDVQILVEGETAAMLTDEEQIDENLPSNQKNKYRRQKAIISVSIYRADGVICRKPTGQLVENGCRNMFVKIHFAGNTRQTSLARNSILPNWNESVSFIETVPTTFQSLVVELWDKSKGYVGGTTLSLSDLSFDKNEEKTPIFGPTFIYLYNDQTKRRNGITFAARLLIGVSNQVIDKNFPENSKSQMKIRPLDEKKVFPHYKNFSLFVAVFQGIFFDKKYFKVPVYLSVRHGGNFQSSEVSEEVKINLDKSVIAVDNTESISFPYSALALKNKVMCAQTNNIYPTDYDREKRLNQIKRLTLNAKSALENCQKKLYSDDHSSGNELLKAIKQICESILKILKKYKGSRLEEEKMEGYKAKIKTIILQTTQLLNNKSPITIILTKAELFLSIMKKIDVDVSPTFPSIEIAISTTTQKEEAQILLDPQEFLYSSKEIEAGVKCGRIESVWIRDIVGHDIAALDLFIWFGESSLLAKNIKFPAEMNESPISFKGVLPDEVHCFQLRAHVYQARLQPGADESGLADPFIRVYAHGDVRESQVKAQTLDPFWDETLMFSNIALHGQSQFIKQSAMGVVFEVLDYDGANVYELVGRGVCKPYVKLVKENYKAPRLEWVKIYALGDVTGEVLMTIELLEIDPPGENEEKITDEAIRPSRNRLFAIPNEIRPHFRLYQLEVLFWGLRNLSYNRATTKILLIIECNGIKIESNIIKAESAINFDCPIQKTEILLPEEPEYSPPLGVELYTIATFNKITYTASCVLQSVLIFTKRPEEEKEVIENKVGETKYKGFPQIFKKKEPEKNFDEDEKDEEWWSKYYKAKFKSQAPHMKIYDCELENVKEFNGFTDYLQPFQLTKGKLDSKKGIVNQEYIGTFKGAFRLYEIPSEFFSATRGALDSFPKSENLPITVRVYIVSASNLAGSDANGRCDPYISLQLGDKKIVDRKNYIFKETNPVFGKYFELKANFPTDHTLIIRIMDHDVGFSDDMIGTTWIDIENRFYSKHRASCGLARCYVKTQWRDLNVPTDILKQVCEQNRLPQPVYTYKTAAIGSFTVVRYSNESHEKSALRLLNNLHKMPKNGFALVPEHIETRSLFHPKKPHIEQGRLEMWVDIFPGHSNLPPPRDIAPPQPEKIELRVTIYNTEDIPPADHSYLTGDDSSDIFVKAWLTSQDTAQRTDTHYRSYNGEGNFNWRFIFPIEYSPVEHKVIVKSENIFGGGKVLEKIPCTLEVQVWDNDLISDDFVGFLALNLWDMPSGAKHAKSADISAYEKNSNRIDLFKVGRNRGWWAFKTRDHSSTDDYKLAGRVEMELQLMSEKEAALHPAGLGREGPQPLPEPLRPHTTFFRMVNPFRIVRHMIFGKLGRKILCLSFLAGIILFFLLGIYSIPGYSIKKIMQA